MDIKDKNKESNWKAWKTKQVTPLRLWNNRKSTEDVITNIRSRKGIFNKINLVKRQKTKKRVLLIDAITISVYNFQHCRTIA